MFNIIIEFSLKPRVCSNDKKEDIEPDETNLRQRNKESIKSYFIYTIHSLLRTVVISDKNRDKESIVIYKIFFSVVTIFRQQNHIFAVYDIIKALRLSLKRNFCCTAKHIPSPHCF